MKKDLTNSRLDRQNIINLPFYKCVSNASTLIIIRFYHFYEKM